MAFSLEFDPYGFLTSAGMYFVPGAARYDVKLPLGLLMLNVDVVVVVVDDSVSVCVVQASAYVHSLVGNLNTQSGNQINPAVRL